MASSSLPDPPPRELETRTTCCYCGTGCGVIVTSEAGRVVGVRGDPDHPSNRGRLCSKGTTLPLTMSVGAMAQRARHPEMRMARGQARRRATWDEALDHVAERFAETIARHGPDAVAFYVSGQLLTEDYYAFNRLAKGTIGTANIDTNSRLCMSSAVSGYVKTLGADAPPACYDDIEQAGCLFIAGSNTAFAHPVLFRRIEAAKAARPEVKIVVVDPRRTETARFADLHLPILPGTDVALFHAMLHVMLWDGLVDEAYVAAHTEGFEAVRDLAREWSPKAAAEICGVRAEDIVTAARWFAGCRPREGGDPSLDSRLRGNDRLPTLSLYCQGLNQSTSGTAKNATLIGLHLATGQIGKPGAGPLSLTGQPNAMGGREVGGLATTLAAHRDLANADHRGEMAFLWNSDRIPSKPGLTAVELFEAVAAGRVKCLWIACTNPAQSLPNLPSVHAALQAAELVVLQEAYADTETAPFADVLLPAASWAEKEGTVTNSERRISRVRAAVPPPGEARPDWSIACDFESRLRTHLSTPPDSPQLDLPVLPAMQVRREKRVGGSWGESPLSLWNEHRESTRGRDLDITGLSYEMLERDGPQQWPFPTGAVAGSVRLYADGQFPTGNGRAKFFAENYRAVAEPVDARYPLRLITGRLRDQWHGMSRTGRAGSLFGHVPEPRMAMNASDLARRGLADGELVRVESRRGALYVIAQADESIRSGQAYLPMHWGKRFLGGRASAGVNTITLSATDPISRQPELKHAAIRVSPASLAWRGVAFAEADEAAIGALIAALHAAHDEVAFLSVVPAGRGRPGVLVRAANEGAPDAAWVAALDGLLGLGDGVLRYDDPRRGHARRVLVRDGRLIAGRISGAAEVVSDAEWLRDWMLGGAPVAEVRRFLLAPQRPSDARVISGSDPVVCNCFGMTATRIAEGLARGERLECGTNCGSCLPEVRAIAERVAANTGKMVA
jgi:assimilatory nitrate reductase catalytic subunit